MGNINKNLGIVIQKLRNQQGISQEELAERSGLHRTYISDIERGNRNITINSLYKIANAFQIDLSELIKGAEHYE